MHSLKYDQTDLDSGVVLLVDKPLTWTSFDVVKKLKYALKVKKIGHAGTLDPLATGLLILCTGKKTKEIDLFQAKEKEYTGVLEIGKTTPSVDLETEFDSETDARHISMENIVNSAGDLTGTLEQIPPRYSAIKINGERVYKKARKGEFVVMKPRQVEVSHFEITRFEFPEVSFRIVCSKGTYVRSLVRDLGESLGVGAYLKSLCRTRIGDHLLENALSIDDAITLRDK